MIQAPTIAFSRALPAAGQTYDIPGLQWFGARRLMRLGINLRGDLAKLSDAEITAEFDRLLADRESHYPAAPALWSFKALWRYGFMLLLPRGPLHARIFYKWTVGYFGPFKSRLGALYLLDCEIMDVRDEIERRVKEGKRAKAA